MSHPVSPTVSKTCPQKRRLYTLVFYHTRIQKKSPSENRQVYTPVPIGTCGKSMEKPFFVYSISQENIDSPVYLSFLPLTPCCKGVIDEDRKPCPNPPPKVPHTGPNGTVLVLFTPRKYHEFSGYTHGYSPLHTVSSGVSTVTSVNAVWPHMRREHKTYKKHPVSPLNKCV